MPKDYASKKSKWEDLDKNAEKRNGLQFIMTRKSVRAFKKRPIDKSILESLVLAASNAPSYTNSQWEMAVVMGEKKEELAQSLYKAAMSRLKLRPHIPFPKMWPAEIKESVSLHRRRRLEAAGVHLNGYKARRHQFLQDFLFFGAPVIIIVYIERDLGIWSAFDVGLFVQNLVLSAHSMGLATCTQAMPVGYPGIITKCLGLPSSRKIVVAVSLGYEGMKTPRSTGIGPRRS